MSSDVHIQVKAPITKHICAGFLLVLHEDVVAAGGGAGCVKLWVSAQQGEQPSLNDLGGICGCVWQVLIINLRHATRMAREEARHIVGGLDTFVLHRHYACGGWL